MFCKILLTRFSKKQYTSYLTKRKIHKNRRSTGLELECPHLEQSLSNQLSQTTESDEEEEESPPESPCCIITPCRVVSDLRQNAIKPSPYRTIRRVENLPHCDSNRTSASIPLEILLDEDLLNTIFGYAGEALQSHDDPEFIRRTADTALLFHDLQSSPQFQQVFGRLQAMINSRPANFHCRDIHVFSLLHAANVPAYDHWSDRLTRLSRRVFLLICSLWTSDDDIFCRGHRLLELITTALLYCSGKDIVVDESLKSSELLKHSNSFSPKTFADHLYQNCSQYVSTSRAVKSEADWTDMLLRLPSSHSLQDLRAAQIASVVRHVSQKHTNCLKRILVWSDAVLREQNFLNFRQKILHLCSTVPSLDLPAHVHAVATEKYALYQYLTTSYWQLRGSERLATTNIPSGAGAIVSDFRVFIDEFGMSEFDMFRGIVMMIVSQVEFQLNQSTWPPSTPPYLDSDNMECLFLRFVSANELEKCSEIARWWLSCWIWEEGSLQNADFRQTPLTAQLENFMLASISAGFARTHPFHQADIRTEPQSGNVNVLPTLYEGVTRSHVVRISGSASERNSYNTISSPTLSKRQDQRSSGGSSDYDNFAKSGCRDKPSKRIPTVPSDGLQDLHEEGADISRAWRWSESSKSSGGSGARHSDYRSISGLSLRRRLSGTLSRHRRSSSVEGVQKDTKMRDYFQEAPQCMSPRPMSEISMTG